MNSKEDQAVIEKLSFMAADIQSVIEEAKESGCDDFYKYLCFTKKVIEEYKAKHELLLKVGN
jgi:hypothetical protein